MDEDAAAALEELVRRRVIHEAGDAFEFTHDRIRTAVHGGLLPPRRTVLHRRLAEALEASHPEACETAAPAIAWHAFSGEVRDKAVDYLRRAAALAVTRAAYRQAADYLDQALRARRSGSPRRSASTCAWRRCSRIRSFASSGQRMCRASRQSSGSVRP